MGLWETGVGGRNLPGRQCRRGVELARTRHGRIAGKVSTRSKLRGHRQAMHRRWRMRGCCEKRSKVHGRASARPARRRERVFRRSHAGEKSTRESRCGVRTTRTMPRFDRLALVLAAPRPLRSGQGSDAAGLSLCSVRLRGLADQIIVDGLGAGTALDTIPTRGGPAGQVVLKDFEAERGMPRRSAARRACLRRSRRTGAGQRHGQGGAEHASPGAAQSESNRRGSRGAARPLTTGAAGSRRLAGVLGARSRAHIGLRVTTARRDRLRGDGRAPACLPGHHNQRRRRCRLASAALCRRRAAMARGAPLCGSALGAALGARAEQHATNRLARYSRSARLHHVNERAARLSRWSALRKCRIGQSQDLVS